MANDDTEQWHLPKPLQISNPKVAEAAAQMRKDLEPRTVSPFARLSPIEFGKIRARARIDHLFSALRQVDEEIKVNRGRDRSHQLHEARTALRSRLAENLAIVGNFALAAEITPDKRYADEYATKARASFEGRADLY